jgi:hypothetical protein
MSLVNVRAAFEKAVTDAVAAVDPTVTMVYDNVPYTTPSKTTKYIAISVNFNRSTLQNMGAAADFYTGVITCNVYVPKNAGTSTLASISGAVIDGLTSVNASGYTDTFTCDPRVLDIVGPTPLDIEDRSHFIGLISCQFTANA